MIGKFNAGQFVWIDYGGTRIVQITNTQMLRNDYIMYTIQYRIKYSVRLIPEKSEICKILSTPVSLNLQNFQCNYIDNYEISYDIYEDDNLLFETEEELVNFANYNIFISSKDCYKNELKYKLRELKLNRILNG